MNTTTHTEHAACPNRAASGAGLAATPPCVGSASIDTPMNEWGGIEIAMLCQGNEPMDNNQKGQWINALVFALLVVLWIPVIVAALEYLL